MLAVAGGRDNQRICSCASQGGNQEGTRIRPHHYAFLVVSGAGLYDYKSGLTGTMHVSEKVFQLPLISNTPYLKTQDRDALTSVIHDTPLIGRADSCRP